MNIFNSIKKKFASLSSYEKRKLLIIVSCALFVLVVGHSLIGTSAATATSSDHQKIKNGASQRYALNLQKREQQRVEIEDGWRQIANSERSAEDKEFGRNLLSLGLNEIELLNHCVAAIPSSRYGDSVVWCVERDLPISHLLNVMGKRLLALKRQQKKSAIEEKELIYLEMFDEEMSLSGEYTDYLLCTYPALFKSSISNPDKD